MLSSHSSLRSEVVPTPATPLAQPGAASAPDKPASKGRYIRWADLLRRVFGIEVVCTKCQTPLRLISLIKSEPIARKILTAMHLPADVPELHPARSPPGPAGAAGGHEPAGDAQVGADWLN